VDPNPQRPDEQLAEAGWVRRLAQNMLRDPVLAEDVTQESAIAAWQHGPI
jgi:DNA-directed RNA polymerase specialized sigma24 family protein